MKILLYSPKPSNRLDYIVSFIFNHLLGRPCSTTNNTSDYQSFTGVKINYSKEKTTNNEVWIKPHPLLSEKTIYKQTISVSKRQDIDTFFCTQAEPHFPFDLFASSFYLLSRYEEYLPFKADQHHRYRATQSLAFKAGFLEKPIINEWVTLLVIAIQKIFPNFSPILSSYEFLPTYDIDIPWAFRHRGFRGWARTGLDLLSGNWPMLKARNSALRDEKKDPFFCFQNIKNKHQRFNIRPKIFWLVANSGKYDINPDYRLKAFQNLIVQTNKWSNSGLHPSYLSNNNPKLILKEKQRLEKILNQPITESRQHFLRLHLPQTYRQLITSGIEDDYSMGFADKVGYRAGTSESFLWYDLLEDKTTSLRIHPFVAMDVTLKQYERYTPQQAYEKLSQLQTYCKSNQLKFRTLWHNSSFSALHGWQNWDEIYWKLFE